MSVPTEMICVGTTDNLMTIALRGRLDSAGVDAIETKFAATAKHKNVAVDLSEVTFLASMGIRMLIGSARALGRNGSKMVLFAPQELVNETLSSSGVDQIIDIVADEPSAIAKLNS
jgi:anti-anti-sigma factor